jgi:hypothetical protein
VNEISYHSTKDTKAGRRNGAGVLEGAPAYFAATISYGPGALPLVALVSPGASPFRI